MPTPPPIPIPTPPPAPIGSDPTARGRQRTRKATRCSSGVRGGVRAAAAHAAAAAASARRRARHGCLTRENPADDSRRRSRPGSGFGFGFGLGDVDDALASWRRGWRRTIEAPAGTRRNTTSSPPRESNANISWTRRTTKTIRLRRENSARGSRRRRRLDDDDGHHLTDASLARVRERARAERAADLAALSRARSRAGRERAFPSETGEDRRPACSTRRLSPFPDHERRRPPARISSTRSDSNWTPSSSARGRVDARERTPANPVRAVRAGRRRRRGGRVEKTRRDGGGAGAAPRGMSSAARRRAPNESDARDEDVLGESVGSGRTRAVSCVAFARARATTDARDARGTPRLLPVLRGCRGWIPGTIGWCARWRLWRDREGGGTERGSMRGKGTRGRSVRNWRSANAARGGEYDE